MGKMRIHTPTKEKKHQNSQVSVLFSSFCGACDLVFFFEHLEQNGNYSITVLRGLAVLECNQKV